MERGCTVYNKIKELAEKKGVTMAEVLRATGLPESTLYSMNYRNGGMSIKNLTKIADYFGVSLDYFRE